MIAYPDVVIPSLSGVLTEKDFWAGHHRTIYGVLRAMHSASVGIDLVSIDRRLKEIGQKETCGSPGSLATFIAELVTHLNVSTHAATVKRMSRCREIVDTARTIAIKATKTDLTGVEENLTALLESIKEEAKTETLIPVKVASERILADIHFRRQNPTVKNYLPSGYHEIDSIIKGFRPKEMTIIAARPGGGKTSFALNIVANMARLGVKVGIISIEMSAGELLERLYANEAGLALDRFEEPMTDEEVARFESARAYVDKWNLHIDEATLQTIESAPRMFEKMRKEFGIEIGFLDYIELLTDDASRTATERMTRSSQALLRTVHHLGIPLVVLAQFNRTASISKKDDDGKPCLHHLKASGQLEQDAHRVLGLHWKGPKPGIPSVTEAEVCYLKQRRGRADPFGNLSSPLDYVGKHLRFQEPLPDFCVRPKN